MNYDTKYCTTKVNNKILVILPESDIYCLENNCQTRWTAAESDHAMQKISKIVYFLLKKN